MIHDDDISRHEHFEIRGSDRSDRVEPGGSSAGRRRVELPSDAVQNRILQLAQYPGWDVERIHDELRLGRHDVSKEAIKFVLAQDRIRRQQR